MTKPRVKRARASGQAQRGSAQIAEQHHQLRASLAVIVATETLNELVPRLTRLRADLAAHFAEEERDDGLAQAVSPAAPHHLRRLEALLAEHSQLLASLDDLIHRGEGLLGGPVKEILTGARSLARRLARHEAAETALLTDAVYVEFGGG